MVASSTPQPSAKPGFNRTILVVLLIIIVGVAVVMTTVFIIVPSQSVTRTKNFPPYTTPLPANNSPTKELTVSDIDGDISIQPWSQSNILINGTITARGYMANPDLITFLESNNNGDIVFQANFPSIPPFFAPSYTVNINVYLPPPSPNLQAIVATTVNGNMRVSNVTMPSTSSSVDFEVTNGELSVSGVTTSNMGLIDTNGNIDLSCSSALCYGVQVTTTNGAIDATLTTLYYGNYTFNDTNGNINLHLPVSGSYKITSNTTNGSVSSTGLPIQLTNHVQSTIGSGTGTVTATTTNGSISVTGT